MLVVASAEQVGEMTDDFVSVVAAVVVMRIVVVVAVVVVAAAAAVVVVVVVVVVVAAAAAVDADVFVVAVVDKHIGSVENCQFHCYPRSRPTEKRIRNNYITQLTLVINFITHDS
jgi:hypothetical protein